MDRIKRISFANPAPAEYASHPAHPVILSPLLPADVFIIHHGNDFTPNRKNQKTYRRLFGMIFFAGSEPMVVTPLQRLAARKNSKTVKTQK